MRVDREADVDPGSPFTWDEVGFGLALALTGFLMLRPGIGRRLLRRLRTQRIEPPLLVDLEPAFAQELEQLLQQKRRRRLAASVSELRVVEVCACGDPRCASFYVIPRFILRWRWPGQGETLDFGAAYGTITVDVVDHEIVSVEVLDREVLLRALNTVREPLSRNR